MTTAPLMTSYSATGGRGRHQGRYAELHLSRGHDHDHWQLEFSFATGKYDVLCFALPLRWSQFRLWRYPKGGDTFANSLTKAIMEDFEAFKDSGPGMDGYQLNNQNFEWVSLSIQVQDDSESKWLDMRAQHLGDAEIPVPIRNLLPQPE